MGKNLIQQRRGRGTSVFRALSFHSEGEVKFTKEGKARVVDLIRSNMTSAPLAVVEYEADSSKGLLIAAEGIKTGDVINIGEGASLTLGNVLYLKDIPVGTFVFNIESSPGDGGKFVRSSGASARIVSKMNGEVSIQLPSKKTKVFNENCRACIGVVSGGGRPEKPFLKAGNKYKVMRARNKYWPNVSGISMNAVAHPFGGKHSSKKGRPLQASRYDPPGRKVGMLSPKKTGRGK